MLKKLKIGYFADGIWSHRAFEKIVANQSFEVVFIVPRYDTQDQTLLNFAKKYKIPYLKTQNINSVDFLNKIIPYQSDIFVSMSFNQIFKEPLILLPPLKTINCHAGKLPFYRGRNILNWVLINDEKDFGITVHYIDEGIDTGDIVLQKTFPISDQDDYSSLLYTAHIQCAELLYQALLIIQKGQVKPIPQNKFEGFYCPMRLAGDEIINWDQESRAIFNFIRALNAPNLGAMSFIEDHPIRLYRSQIIKNAPKYIAIPGSVVGIEESAIIVKTRDSTIKIIDYNCERKIKIGDRFTSERKSCAKNPCYC